MSIAIALQGVAFTVNAGYESEEKAQSGAEPDQVVLGFLDPPTGIQTTIVFDHNGWQAFKRHVAADGKMPTDITIAQAGDLSKLPTMAVPQGKQ